MYVVTVEFIIAPDHRSEFGQAVIRQAENSLALESDCHTFLVSVDESNPCRFFLYEEYADRAAFDQHLASTHFHEFDALVASWVESKKVDTWQRQ